MARNKILSLLLLYPISKVYGMVVALRNMMFDKGLILRQREMEIPVVVVGNIAMGGAGKTPHTEYIVEKLRNNFKIGVLSRGYKRRTKGFVLASNNTSAEDIGDEPYQIHRRFSKHGVTVAVCEKRVEGIERMREINPELDLMVLDDAFQHRYVKPTVAVVLTEFGRPPFEDHLLPFGHLREPMRALDRADVVIVTKCPDDIKPVDFRLYKEKLNLYPYQKLMFSRYVYQPPVPIFPDRIKEGQVPSLEWFSESDAILAVAGVANPRPFVRYLRRFGAKMKIKRFDDHHNFTHSDMMAIERKFNDMKGRNKILVTTEKDAVRLASNPYFPHKLMPYAFYLPIKVEIIQSSADISLEEIIQQIIRTQSKLKS